MCDWLHTEIGSRHALYYCRRAFAILMEFWKKFVDDLVAILATKRGEIFCEGVLLFSSLCVFKSNLLDFSMIIRGFTKFGIKVA